MTNKYDPKSIEPKWQKYWEDNKTFAATEDSTKEKFFGLIEFPYPSGAGLHVGHARPFTMMDVVTRKKRMEQKSVLFPIGFDSSGLPTENYAIKTGRRPEDVTEENMANFTRQLKMLGYGFDWDRVVNTMDPKYYKWTQWIFIQLFKQGLAYKTNMPINWCLNCKIGLANEEVVDGKCERCGGPVEKRDKEQWMLAITKYADKLLNGLDTVDYIPQAKTQQQNWIGRSEGAEIEFVVIASEAKQSSSVEQIATSPAAPRNDTVTVFTTRPDTLFGATYMVLAPEHQMVNDLKSQISNWDEVEVYINDTKKKTDLERSAEGKEKTGVELKGVKAINPVNGEQIPLFIADYVLGGYGTGAIMAVPAHDERDFEFAKKYNLAVKQVVAPHIVLTGDCTPREEKETSRKDVVSAIVRNKKTNEYLVLNWENKRFGFIGGGIESGETYEEAIKRELIEETGYTSFEIVREVIPYLYGHGYKPRKDINCFDLDKVFLIDILDTEKQEDNENVAGEHSLEWLEEKEMSAVLTLDHHKFIWNWFINNEECFSDGGIAINSDFLNGLATTEAKEKMIQHLEEKNIGKRKVQFKLRDWVFSRQRYWGEPIPLVYCEHCAKTDVSANPGWVPLPDDQLPLELPKVEKYQPTDTGESPLSVMTDWVNTKCPQCGGAARRETDTMPNWAGSSWYFLAYTMAKENGEFVWDRTKMNYWLKDSIDWYNGGMEHTVLHLLYSRFWNQFLFDIGAVLVSEPYKKRTSHGMILAEDGRKMSKSLGNVVNPDEMVEKFGTDAFRTYIMFMGPFDQAVAWDTNGVVGVRRFLNRIYDYYQDRDIQKDDEMLNTPVHVGGVEWDVHEKRRNEMLSALQLLIKKVTEDIDTMRFNTAVAAMMEFSNKFMVRDHNTATVNWSSDAVVREISESFVKLLSPFAPHLAEDIWKECFKYETSVATASWPVYDASLVVTDEITIVAQVNGKVRDEFVVSPDISEEEIKALVLGSEKIQRWMEGKEPKKVIYVKGKLVSIVV